MTILRRRDFLKLTTVSATAVLPGCGSDEPDGDTPGGDAGPPPSDDPERQRATFPQGVASGDPTPSSVILWTRVEPDDNGNPDVTWEIARDAAFTDRVASGSMTLDDSTDHTLKLKVTDLEAWTRYYYRFIALGVVSVTGETKTAPAPDADVGIRFAFATCQDRVGRYYHAWRALLEEADSAPVDFVVFLGDYVYETAGDPQFQTPSDDRKVILPDGLDLGAGGLAAQTLEDYRALYKQYRSDEYLQEAHRRFPFLVIWDDHEFANDCWQDHSNFFSEVDGLVEKVPEQRQAADRAWYEYQPAEVTYDENALHPGTIKIYRKHRFGKHLELFLTDQRYYRDDHVIPEGPAELAVAKFLENSSIGSRIFLLKPGFDPIEAAARPTMLGAAQKAWLVDSMKASDATWKVWGSEVQLAQMVTDLSPFEDVPEAFRDRFYITVDQWDGYRSERAEILSALESVENLVVIVGDVHASYASYLHVDFDAPSDRPAAVEFTIAGISSGAVALTAQGVIGGDPTLSGLGLLELIPRWDELLREASPHYQYGNSFTNGVAIGDLNAERLEMTYLHVSNPREQAFQVTERVRFRTTAGSRTIEVL
jgi:alkaline phosphatase D